jgi:hypothetical protein
MDELLSASVAESAAREETAGKSAAKISVKNKNSRMCFARVIAFIRFKIRTLLSFRPFIRIRN